MMSIRSSSVFATAVLLAGAVLAGCGGDETSTGGGPSGADPAAGSGDPASIVVYCGRSDAFVQTALEKFTESTGIEVELKQGKSGALAQTLVKEGENSPADVFWSQDAGALGVVAGAGGLAELSESTLGLVDPIYRAKQGTWVGITGRARAATFNTDKVKAADLPDSILGFTDPKWKGRLGWAPKNASFQAFVTALRKANGDDAARAWLAGIHANEPKVYPKNTPAVKAAADGEIDVALVNHYYLFRVLRDRDGKAPIENGFFAAGDIGNLINVSGAGVVKTSTKAAAAEKFVAFLLSPEIQQVFTDENQEYPLVDGVKTHEKLKPLSEIGAPDLDLNQLSDMQATVDMLRDLGILD